MSVRFISLENGYGDCVWCEKQLKKGEPKFGWKPRAKFPVFVLLCPACYAVKLLDMEKYEAGSEIRRV